MKIELDIEFSQYLDKKNQIHRGKMVLECLEELKTMFEAHDTGNKITMKLL